MRLSVTPEGPVDQLALLLNLAPTPVPEVMFGMAGSRVLTVAARLGLFVALARPGQTLALLATHCQVAPEGLLHLLGCLQALGYVQVQAHEQTHDRAHEQTQVYALSSRARKWLDPASDTYVGTFLDFNEDQWQWWSQLEGVLRSGRPFSIHQLDADDPGWTRYITAMFELARLSADEVAGLVPVPRGAQRLLDVAGGHGLFAAKLCAKQVSLRATVLDLPGSVRVGRALMQQHGYAQRVQHVEGDIFTAPLDGPYDVIVYFQTLRHFSPEQNLGLFKRLKQALAPGGVLAVMDYLAPDVGLAGGMGAFVGLNYYLTTGGALYSLRMLKSALADAGFSRLRVRSVLRLPFQKLVLARA